MKLRQTILAGVLGVTLAASMAGAAAAEEVQIGWRGDVTYDGTLSVADIVLLQKYLLGVGTFPNEMAAAFADLDLDGKVNGFDLTILKKCLMDNYWFAVTENVEETETTENPSDTQVTEPEEDPTETTEPTEESTDPVEEPGYNDFITPPIAQVNASLPSQREANLVIFYVDFPDCRYETSLTQEQLQEIAFGAEDLNDANYPFDSMSAFYDRSSKGVMDLQGKVFVYTAQESITAYNEDKVKLAKECFEAFTATEDFSAYDGDGDGMIDATLFTVPTAANEDYWWPCAGGFGDPTYMVDGVTVGHIITGNAAPESATEYRNFNSSYLHEMGHCMGLPDYYLYYSPQDQEGFHGNAGSELMDADAYSDFGCFSKLMLGWYKNSAVTVYDDRIETQSFVLKNAQTSEGNCLIIPNGELTNGYFSEYFILEYVTPDGNNMGLPRDRWWESVGDGIRIYHVQAELYSDYWWTYLKYQNGSEHTGMNDDGIRLIRLVDDSQGGSVFTTGNVVNRTTPGFGWYDANEAETIAPGVTITIGEKTENGYQVLVTKD